MAISSQAYRAALIAVLLFLAACASTPPDSTATVIRTVHEPSAGDAAFRNVVVIGVAGDHATRASFEGMLGSALSGEEASATPWFAVMGHRPFLTRDGLMTAIRSREFDAVVLTRQKGQENRGGAPGRPVGKLFQLFEYDYPELNVAAQIAQTQTIEFVTEVWRTADFKKIWSIETLSFDKADAQSLIDEQAASIAKVLLDDGVIAN